MRLYFTSKRSHVDSYFIMILVHPCLASSKLVIVLFYARIFTTPTLRRAIWIVGAATLLWLLATFPVIVLWCLPVNKVRIPCSNKRLLLKHTIGVEPNCYTRPLHQPKSLFHRPIDTQCNHQPCTPLSTNLVRLAASDEHNKQDRLELGLLHRHLVRSSPPIHILILTKPAKRQSASSALSLSPTSSSLTLPVSSSNTLNVKSNNHREPSTFDPLLQPRGQFRRHLRFAYGHRPTPQVHYKQRREPLNTSIQNSRLPRDDGRTQVALETTFPLAPRRGVRADGGQQRKAY